MAYQGPSSQSIRTSEYSLHFSSCILCYALPNTSFVDRQVGDGMMLGMLTWGKPGIGNLEDAGRDLKCLFLFSPPDWAY